MPHAFGSVCFVLLTLLYLHLFSLYRAAAHINMPLPTRLPSANNNNADRSVVKQKEVLANRYTIERTLGSGNCGTALLAVDRKDKNELQ
jgi:hypothetical protein